MTALLTTAALLFSFPLGGYFPPGDNPEGLIVGNFTHYAQSPTDGTIDYRQSVGELPADLSAYTVFLATIQTCDVGATGWIRPVREEGKGEWERFIVFDCAGHSETVDNLFEPGNIIGEIDFYTASDDRWDTIGHGIRGEMVFD